MNNDTQHLENVYKIKTNIFRNDFEGGFVKTMWRMGKGNRDYCFNLIKNLATNHYGFTPSDYEIEWALAEMNGGCEVEFLS